MWYGELFMTSMTSAPAARAFCGGQWKPHVFANADSETDTFDLEHERFIARGKVSLFVENGVVRQFLFEIGTDDGAVYQNGTGVVTQSTLDQMMAHQYKYIVKIGQFVFKPVQFQLCGRMKTVLQKQVFRRIAGQGQFRCQDDIGSERSRFPDEFCNAFAIAGQISDGTVIWAMATLGDIIFVQINE